MRTIFLGVVVLRLCSVCVAGPVGMFVPDKSDGVEIVAPPDGQWQYRTVEGRKAACLRTDAGPTNWYLYVKLDPQVREKIRDRAWVVVDFFDVPVGMVGIQYNTKKSPYESASGFLLLNTKKWQRASICIDGAKFEGRQNGGADFRLNYTGSLAISRVEVYASDPKLAIPTSKARALENSFRLSGSKPMFYTFGGVDEPSAALYKWLGVTSVESYVTWETCERAGQRQWDWSQWDSTVRILKDNHLKWVPFIILGPAYSTPNWFRASKDHVPCRCLEHDVESKIESRWNPNLPKYIDRFLAEFAKRYGKSDVIESVLLGIQGDYGEAIYSVSGGGWTFSIPGEYHNHAGYWCADPFAMASFRKYVSGKYGTAADVNKAWGTSFAAVNTIDFPGRKGELAAFEKEILKGDPKVRRRWLDFIDWYRSEMTAWSDWWIATTRRHFPKTPIYLCTGGDAEPHHGSNFAEQCRAAAKYGAGVRITNEGSDYAANFAITRWVASAGKHYGAFYGFEPAGEENEAGIVARIYNATASGANQLHDYPPNVVSSQSRINMQRSHLKWLFHVPHPVVPVALWYPNVDMTLHWGGYYGQARMLRDLVDYDYVDETMLHSGALATHRVLVILHGAVMEKEDANRIARWIKTGQRAIVMGVPKFESVEGGREPETTLFGDTPSGRSLGKGQIVRVTTEADLAVRLGKDMRDLGLAVYDLRKNGVFGTQIDVNKFMFLNTGAAAAKVKVECKRTAVERQINGGTISEVEVK